MINDFYPINYLTLIKLIFLNLFNCEVSIVETLSNFRIDTKTNVKS